MTGPWSATAETPSTRCGCGRPPRPTISISSNSAAAILSARWPKRSRPKPSRACCTPTIQRPKAKACASCRNIFSWPASLADALRRFRAAGNDWSALPDKVAMQLNDTHPTLAVPELMRILLDEANLDWDEAWDLTQRTLGVHEPHAAARSAGEMAAAVVRDCCCRAISRSFTKSTAAFWTRCARRYPGDDGARRARKPDRRRRSRRRSAWRTLAIVGSHSTNGVAAIHSELLKQTVVPDFAELFPERFNNKTNGVTPAAFSAAGQSALAAVITDAIGDGWITDLDQFENLKPLADDEDVSRRHSPAQNARPRCGSPTGSSPRPARSWTPTPFSTRRSSASTNTNGSS